LYLLAQRAALLAPPGGAREQPPVCLEVGCCGNRGHPVRGDRGPRGAPLRRTPVALAGLGARPPGRGRRAAADLLPPRAPRGAQGPHGSTFGEPRRSRNERWFAMKRTMIRAGTLVLVGLGALGLWGCGNEKAAASGDHAAHEGHAPAQQLSVT